MKFIIPLLLSALLYSSNTSSEAGMIPFDSPVGEIGGRGHWYTLRTMKGKDYWKDAAVLPDIRKNEDGTYSVLGEAPVSLVVVLHPEWYKDDEPWRHAIDWIRQAEQIYRNSGVPTRFVIEAIVMWNDFPDTVYDALYALDFDKYVNLGTGADIVVGLKPVMAGDPYCGVAYIGGRSNISSCNPKVLAHELGHNFGLRHAHQGGSAGHKGYCIRPEPDAIDCYKGTIMSYAGSGRVPFFAANGFTYNGDPLGTEEHTAVEHLRESVIEMALRYEISEGQEFSLLADANRGEEMLCR